MSVFFIFDIVGTIAFAAAGALTGVQKKLDLFGVVILALTTAVGGGIVRDIIISNTPPLVFRHPVYVIVSIVAALIVVVIHKQITRFNMVIQVCDAVGLGAFAVAGAKMAVSAGYPNYLMIAFLAVVTGVGGGVLRDIFVREIPGVFCRDIYAVAALAGATSFYFAYPYVAEDLAMYICFVVTTLLRLLALKYGWHLPIV